MDLDLLYELEAKVIRTVEIGGGATGGRTDFYMQGKVSGKINGSYEGVDYGSTVKTERGDAVYVHVHETIKTDKGIISAFRRGYAIPSGQGYNVRAFVLFQTGVPELRYLNWTLGLAEGVAGPDGLKLKIYAVR
ncbi:hypothetical protein HRbin02_00289 [Candidatus Calditenuaceae archaeon HR02]|nr:hypothetical protein HRbin02_00289 [Candidatus Calditenuaceae archaeon HR02]